MPLCDGTHLIARAKQKRLGDQRFVAMEITYMFALGLCHVSSPVRI